MTARAPAKMHESEADFATWFEDWLKLKGWLWTHFQTSWHRGRFRTAISGDPGFPDYVCVKDGRCLFVELKGDSGQLTAGQKEWIAELRQAREVVYVFRPSDRDEIMLTLT